jgi:hypothetical protein
MTPVIRPRTEATAADLAELVRRARLTRLCHIIHQLLTDTPPAAPCARLQRADGPEVHPRPGNRTAP